jgi:hypothetical protein
MLDHQTTSMSLYAVMATSNKASSMCFMAAVFPDRSHGSSRLVRVYRWLGEVAIGQNQPAEITIFQISEVQESPTFNGRRSFLTLRDRITSSQATERRMQTCGRNWNASSKGLD